MSIDKGRLRNPLKTARGLGSAKDGTHHFVVQRVTAIALVFLSLYVVGLIVSLIGFLGTQSGGLLWYAAKLDARVVALEQADRRILDRGDERFKVINERIAGLERDRDRLTRVEEKVGFIWEAVREMSAKLDAPGRRGR